VGSFAAVIASELCQRRAKLIKARGVGKLVVLYGAPIAAETAASRRRQINYRHGPD
jgi:hypothetical protein